MSTTSFKLQRVGGPWSQCRSLFRWTGRGSAQFWTNGRSDGPTPRLCQSPKGTKPTHTRTPEKKENIFFCFSIAHTPTDSPSGGGAGALRDPLGVCVSSGVGDLHPTLAREIGFHYLYVAFWLGQRNVFFFQVQYVNEGSRWLNFDPLGLFS